MSETIVPTARFGAAGLPTADNLAAAFRNIQNEVGPGGMNILKMDKTGCWVYGSENIEPEEGSSWAVNPFSFIHGYIAWGDRVVLAEHMVSITSPKPEPGAAPDEAPKGWEYQLGFVLKGVDGVDEGVELRFTTTSLGGKRAVQQLSEAIAQQINDDIERSVPIIELVSDHYIHKKYGKTFFPVFKIAGWLSLDGLNGAETEGEEQPEGPAETLLLEAAVEAAPEPKVAKETAKVEEPARRRRRG